MEISGRKKEHGHEMWSVLKYFKTWKSKCHCPTGGSGGGGSGGGGGSSKVSA